MKQATHFIEVVKYPDGRIFNMSPYKIGLFEVALKSTVKFDFQTIAIFKIYLHPNTGTHV